MSREMKHSIRCQLLALLRTGTFTAAKCAVQVSQPKSVIQALLINMETEGLIIGIDGGYTMPMAVAA